MRKFIISDIHGNGNLYYSVMSYLENISKGEDVILYINGDLIDRGIESGEILLDVFERIKENNPHFKIIYLAGNHELMMYEVFEKRRDRGQLCGRRGGSAGGVTPRNIRAVHPRRQDSAFPLVLRLASVIRPRIRPGVGQFPGEGGEPCVG